MNKEKVLNFALLICGLSLLAGFVLVLIYFFSSPAPNEETITANTSTAASLSEKTQKYADCKYSSNTMETTGIGFDIIEANNITDMASRSKVLDTNDQLDEYVKKQCSAFMKQYEQDFEQLKKSNEDMFKSAQSRWDRFQNSDTEPLIPVEQARVDPACFETVPPLYCDGEAYEPKHILSDEELVEFYASHI